MLTLTFRVSQDEDARKTGEQMQVSCQFDETRADEAFGGRVNLVQKALKDRIIDLQGVIRRKWDTFPKAPEARAKALSEFSTRYLASPNGRVPEVIHLPKGTSPEVARAVAEQTGSQVQVDK